MLTDSQVKPVGGSFRDPAGQVFERDGRIYRTVNATAVAAFDFVSKSRFYRRAIDGGSLVAAEVVDPHVIGHHAGEARYLLEHPRLPFVSYPYEWTFSGLKAAALFHLDFQLDALEEGIALSDASAYNVQFLGARPIFIDTLSLRKYKGGEFWAGHRQFCEQFLNPLLLRALLGVTHNAWYRGTQEGISPGDLGRLLPFRRKLSRRVVTHVVLQDVFQRTGGGQKGITLKTLNEAGLPLASFRKVLGGLRRWIASLEPKGSAPTVWQDYGQSHGYEAGEVTQKQDFITEFVKRNRLACVWDIGCNTGDYAVAALDGGADYVVGFDFDQGALELAFDRAKKRELRFLPLFLDAANPPPYQGWAQKERYGLQQRADADGVLALALIHHLSVARNAPIGQVVGWLLGLAPRGVLEFVPKEDPKVRELTKLREDIFFEYNKEAFLDSVRASARIERTLKSSSSGRLLVEFSRYE